MVGVEAPLRRHPGRLPRRALGRRRDLGAGRGWALSQALMALSYYTMDTNAVLVLEARRWLVEVLADDGGR